MPTEPETRSDALRDTTEFPMTLAEFELAVQCLEREAEAVARLGEPGWEEGSRMYYRIANRMRDYAVKHAVA